MSNDIEFTKLNNKSKEALLSLSHRFKYLRFVEFYSPTKFGGGGFTVTEFTEFDEYPNFIEELVAEFTKKDHIQEKDKETKSVLIKVKLSFHNHFNGEIIIEPEEESKINNMLQKLHKILK